MKKFLFVLLLIVSCFVIVTELIQGCVDLNHSIDWLDIAIVTMLVVWWYGLLFGKEENEDLKEREEAQK